MSSFAEKIAAAKAHPARFEDVTVSLDAGLAEERDQLMREREGIQNTDDPRLTAAPDTKGIDAQLAELAERELDTLITIRLYRVPGDKWADLTATNPMREGALFDQRFGYNIHGLTRVAAAEFGRIIEDDAETIPSRDQWAELWPLLEGVSFAEVADAIYRLNVLEPAERVARLKKASEAATASNKK